MSDLEEKTGKDKGFLKVFSIWSFLAGWMACELFIRWWTT